MPILSKQEFNLGFLLATQPYTVALALIRECRKDLEVFSLKYAQHNWAKFVGMDRKENTCPVRGFTEWWYRPTSELVGPGESLCTRCHPKPAEKREESLIVKLNRKRGRPRKDKGRQHQESSNRSYWSEDGRIFFLDGWAWVIDLVEVEPGEGESRGWEAVPLCLGRDEDILPILKGQKDIPGDMHPRRRALLESIPEANKHGGVEVTPGATGLQRGSHARAIRNRQKDTRRLKAREGLSFRKAHRQVKGVSDR